MCSANHGSAGVPFAAFDVCVHQERRREDQSDMSLPKTLIIIGCYPIPLDPTKNTEHHREGCRPLVVVQDPPPSSSSSAPRRFSAFARASLRASLGASHRGDLRACSSLPVCPTTRCRMNTRFTPKEIAFPVACAITLSSKSFANTAVGVSGAFS